MRKVLLTSHGRLASGLKDTVEFFVGTSEMITSIDAYVNSSGDYQYELQAFVDIAEEGEAVIFTDIYGGSVNQQITAMVLESGKNIPIVAGMNLPIVLSTVLMTESFTVEKLEAMLEECKLQLVRMSSCSSKEGDEDDFFA